ncbi:MAG TPA: sarcosine oxidase subunit alpha family protein [Stellaceae bacterium]|jgi:sarcosine oxidase subunit alpha|nr:sarcosine oxidase subunit alpha family protein [Stellaceae bacterium]
MNLPPDQPFRLQVGGMIDRSRRLSFRFDGRDYDGHPGDTLASALLANGVRLVARSFKYHRPRGVVAAGIEEPSALVQLEAGAFTEPNRRPTDIALYDGLRATSQHAWPSLAADFGGFADWLSPLLPAGFYYKTFMQPRGVWQALWEPVLRRMAGLGQAPTAADPSRYDKRHTHCDVLVVGGGPAGLAAALAAGRTGARVILADSGVLMGGVLLRRAYRIGEDAAQLWAAETLAELKTLPSVRLLPNTTILGLYDGNYLIAAERVGEALGRAAPVALPRQRLWHIRAARVVLATGALERLLVFPDNDRPGIMLASAVETYLHRYAVMPGRRAVLFANNDDAYAVAAALAASGVAIAGIVDPRPGAGEAARAQIAGMTIYSGHVVSATAGRKSLRRVWVQPVTRDGASVGRGIAIDCDLLAVSGGWNPTLHLFAQAQGRLRFDAQLSAFLPDSIDAAVDCVGAARGSFALGDCLAEGAEAGATAGAACGFGTGEPPALPPANDSDEAPPGPLLPMLRRRARRRAFVDLHNDVTVADIALAVREGYGASEHLKRYTTLGMGTDQGKTGNVAGLTLLAAMTGRDVAGTTTFRPPFVPVSYGLLAGREHGRLADPVRVSPLHDWHVAAGAVFEDVGQWKRARFYPHSGENMVAAVRRECLAVRDRVALLDASTLGKIEVSGRDAGRFLDRVYINHWQNLPVGHCRYGMMCRDDGMAFDDGVGARLAPDRYFLTTTTGNAAAVLDWLDEWLQTEWPDLDVFCVSATEQWANLTLAGPRARDVLRKVAPHLSLDAAAFPFMRLRETEIGGVPVRLFRVSFSGELSYEINVPADYALSLWQVLIEAGEAFGIMPYGTEAMHMLRAEKGFVIIGQETDGSVTPIDLGLGGLVARDKDFLGRRSLARRDTARAGRKQLVGLLPENPDDILPEGAQLVAARPSEPVEDGALRAGPPIVQSDGGAARSSMPGPMIGHVTSSYYGARFGRSFALALIEDGRERFGDPVLAPLPGRVVPARICPPLFYDIAGRRRDG